MIAMTASPLMQHVKVYSRSDVPVGSASSKEIRILCHGITRRHRVLHDAEPITARAG